ncbi:MAG: GNAT family N-acetyltransferase [Candidatus Nanopelagicales bacterium]|jgi:ribosomal-protein-alanine N-acetyltransferase|nr:GNAT family N-acetyltransferase [Candidatus Nanopelagicales bacterium]
MAALAVLSRRTEAGVLQLRQLRRRDARAWREVRARNVEWLSPWEATVPPDSGEAVPSFGQMVARFREEARSGRTLAWAMTLDGRLVGQVTVAGITMGSLRGASIGYWIDSRVAGLGLTPMAVAMACDHCFQVLRLHRIEIVIRPENAASRRVVQKLGFRHEGARPGYLHIDGAWRDHEVFALNAEEAPRSLADVLAARHETSPTRFPGSSDPT